jgi:predicted alpha/beta hydrolase family esterase
VPAFPDTDNPKLDAWLPMLQEVAGTPDENLYLIGHSVGCPTIMRYLESLPEGQKVGGAILVAGYTETLGFDELESFVETKFDFEKIKRGANHFVAIHSDNDPFVPLQYGNLLRDKLGAELIVKHAMKHFSGPANKEGSCLELPDVVESVLKISND